MPLAREHETKRKSIANLEEVGRSHVYDSVCDRLQTKVEACGKDTLNTLPIRNHWRFWVVKFKTRRSVHAAWIMLVDSPDVFFYDKSKYGERQTGEELCMILFQGKTLPKRYCELSWRMPDGSALTASIWLQGTRNFKACLYNTSVAPRSLRLNGYSTKGTVIFPFFPIGNTRPGQPARF